MTLDPEAQLAGNTEAFARAGHAGDPLGFDAAWRRIAPAVYAWARLHVRAPLQARLDPEDLTQEVACRAWAAFPRWDADQGAFRGWAFGIARNVLREALRRLATEPRGNGPALLTTGELVALPDTATAMTRAVARDEALNSLLVRVDALPDEERRLVMFRGLEGMSHGECAVLLAISPEAVAKRWQRVCGKLRAEPRWAELLSA